MRHDVLPPRRKRMKRRARLGSARHWLPKFTGKNVVRAYAKWYGVDLGCVLKELDILGATLDPVHVERLRVTLLNRSLGKWPAIERGREAARRLWQWVLY